MCPATCPCPCAGAPTVLPLPPVCLFLSPMLGTANAHQMLKAETGREGRGREPCRSYELKAAGLLLAHPVHFLARKIKHVGDLGQGHMAEKALRGSSCPQNSGLLPRSPPADIAMLRVAWDSPQWWPHPRFMSRCCGPKAAGAQWVTLGASGQCEQVQSSQPRGSSCHLRPGVRLCDLWCSLEGLLGEDRERHPRASEGQHSKCTSSASNPLVSVFSGSL
jgi:hypothetical protein